MKSQERNPDQTDERWNGRQDGAPTEMSGLAEGRAKQVDTSSRDGGIERAHQNITTVPAGVVDPEREQRDAKRHERDNLKPHVKAWGRRKATLDASL